MAAIDHPRKNVWPTGRHVSHGRRKIRRGLWRGKVRAKSRQARSGGLASEDLSGYSRIREGGGSSHPVEWRKMISSSCFSSLLLSLSQRKCQTWPLGRDNLYVLQSGFRTEAQPVRSDLFFQSLRCLDSLFISICAGPLRHWLKRI